MSRFRGRAFRRPRSDALENWDCLDCGFPCDATDTHCPKCEASLHAQTDDRTVTVDIAHAEETVADAMEKLEAAIAREHGRRTASLRVITGRGLIRDAVRPRLRTLQARGRIVGYEGEGRNPGAFLVRLR